MIYRIYWLHVAVLKDKKDVMFVTATGKRTCNHLPGSGAEPGESCQGGCLPGGLLRNSDDTHFRSVHHL